MTISDRSVSTNIHNNIRFVNPSQKINGKIIAPSLSFFDDLHKSGLLGAKKPHKAQKKLPCVGELSLSKNLTEKE